MNLEAVVKDWTRNGASGELVLAHVGELRREDEVAILCSARFTKKDKPDPGELGRRMERAAKSDAEARGGVQRYRLSLFHTRQRAPADSFAFSLRASLGDETDEPSGKGIVKAMLVQTRRMHELVCKLSEGTAGILAKSQQQMAAELTELRGLIGGQYLDHARTIAELVDNKQARELELHSQAASEARKDRVMGLLENAAPILLASASGSTVVAEILRSLPKDKRALLLESLEEDQVKKLFEAVGRDEAARLASERIVRGQLPPSSLPAPVEASK